MQHWPDKDGKYPNVTLPEFPGVTLTRDPQTGLLLLNGEKIDYADYPRPFSRETTALFTSDLNGDGYPELCLTILVSKESRAFIYDLRNEKLLGYWTTLDTIVEFVSPPNFYFFVQDGALYLEYKGIPDYYDSSPDWADVIARVAYLNSNQIVTTQDGKIVEFY